MSAAPFDTREIIDRLIVRAPTLREVSGAADLAAVTSLSDFPAPCGYVCLSEDRSLAVHKPAHSPAGEQVATRQTMKVAFGVVMAVRNYREQRGAQVTDDLQAILAEERGALLGYVPTCPGARPCELVRGQLISYDDATLLWMDVWQTQQFIGAAP
jgi:hypothetical protein